MNRSRHGSARFATDKETAALTSSGSGLLIGRDTKTAKPLRYDGPAHLLTMAPTRTGKGIGTIIPNLLTADRSVICVDPKVENARITGRARQKFGPVHVLDPFAVTGKPDAVAVMDGLRRWKGSDQWTKDGGRFIPHSTTWLNREGWNDLVSGEKAVLLPEQAKAATDRFEKSKREHDDFMQTLVDARSRASG